MSERSEPGAPLASTIAFGAVGDRLIQCRSGSVSGRARLTSWTSADGQQRHGLSIVVEQIVTVRPHPRTSTSPTAYRPERRDSDSGDLPPPSDRLDDLWPAESSP